MLTTARILFVSGVWVPASGGSEISAHTLAVELSRLGHDISVLTGPTWDGRHGEESVDGVPVRRVPESDLQSAWNDENARRRPQIVLTQLMWSERVLAWAKVTGLPSVYFLRSEGPTLDLSQVSPLSPTAIVANAPTTRDYARRQWAREAPVVLPMVRLSDYQVPPSARRPAAITMFNPIKEKGGHIFRQLAEALPERHFLAIEGWHHWKRPDGEWDLDRLTSSARSYGGTTAQAPEEVILDDLPNVETARAATDTRPFYARTRVLMMPSEWAEPFGRVIVEAMSNSIPVLYSGTGSSDLAAAGAGFRIRHPNRIESWIGALTALDDPRAYAEASAASLNRVATYDMAAELSKINELIVGLVEETT